MKAVIHEPFDKVVASQCGVSVHGFDFKELLLNSDHSHIKRASSHIYDEYIPVLFISISMVDS